MSGHIDRHVSASTSAMRVLIATLTVGGGHLAAAAALEEAWRRLRPHDTIERLDLMVFFSRLHRKLYSEGWVHIATMAPELWGFVFDRTDDPRVTSRLRKTRGLLPSGSRAKFAQFIEKSKPDVVLCTHYLPVEVLGNLKSSPQTTRQPESTLSKVVRTERGTGRQKIRRRGPPVQPFVVSVVTDFEVHAVWMADGVDLYCVAAEESRVRLVARGAAPETVVATGIPVSLKFSTHPNPRAARKLIGVRDDVPVLLVLSGGFGMGPVADVLRQLDKVRKPIQSIVVCGRNEELRRELAAEERSHPTHVLGFASNMHELMAASDLIITKPGGLTVSEALAMGRPLLIVNPIPGQESANSDFLLSHGAAIKVNCIEDIPGRVEDLLGSRKLASMRKAAAVLGRPNAAETICAEVLRRLGGE